MAGSGLVMRCHTTLLKPVHPSLEFRENKYTNFKLVDPAVVAYDVGNLIAFSPFKENAQWETDPAMGKFRIGEIIDIIYGEDETEQFLVHIFGIDEEVMKPKSSTKRSSVPSYISG